MSTSSPIIHMLTYPPPSLSDLLAGIYFPPSYPVTEDSDSLVHPFPSYLTLLYFPPTSSVPLPNIMNAL